MKGNLLAWVLVLLGGALLLRNLGLLDIHLRELLATWWPLVLIALGLALLLRPDRSGKK